MTNATETRRITVVLPLPLVERLRRQLKPGEGMNEYVKRVLLEVAK